MNKLRIMGGVSRMGGAFIKWKMINTNMFVEAFHRLLKKVYLEGKQNRRLDHLLCVLF